MRRIGYAIEGVVVVTVETRSHGAARIVARRLVLACSVVAATGLLLAAAVSASAAPATTPVRNTVRALSVKAAATAQKVTVTYPGKGRAFVVKPTQVKHGAPITITFAKAPISCVNVVKSNPSKGKWKFNVNISAGAKNVKLPALTAGTYKFSCYMNMVLGKLVVK